MTIDGVPFAGTAAQAGESIELEADTAFIDEGVLDLQTLYDAGIVSPAYGVWDIPDEQRVHPDYLKKFLRAKPALAYYKAKLRGSTARRRSLPAEVFLALPVPLPSVEEQRRIVAILDHADALRAKRRQVLAHLNALKQAMFDPLLRDSREWVAIGDIAESTQYGTSAKASDAGEWPVLRMGNVSYEGRLDLTDLKYLDLTPSEVQKYTVRRGDMLFNRTNSADLVGKTSVVDVDRPLAFAGYLVRVRFPQQETAEFVSGYLNSRHGKTVLRGMAKAIVGQANINARELLTIRVPRATVLEHQAFALRVGLIEAQRREVQHAIEADDELFASLQARAFLGEL